VLQIQPVCTFSAVYLYRLHFKLAILHVRTFKVAYYFSILIIGSVVGDYVVFMGA